MYIIDVYIYINRLYHTYCCSHLAKDLPRPCNANSELNGWLWLKLKAT